MKKYYKIAGIELSVSIPDDKMYESERSLSEFKTECVSSPHEFNFTLVDELTLPEGKEIAAEPSFRVYEEGNKQIRYIGSVQNSWESAYIRAVHSGKSHEIELKSAQFKNSVGVHTVLNSLMMEHLVAENHGFIFHTSYIEYENKAILFTAPSGTGKSTQADLWHKYRGAEIINGDRAAIIERDGALFAAGIPFAGSSEYCKNKTLPIIAVVYLKQAPETSIKKLRGIEAFKRIWEGVSVNTWDRKDMASVSDTVQKLVMNVPVYMLSCTPDESAVIALSQELEKL